MGKREEGSRNERGKKINESGGEPKYLQFCNDSVESVIVSDNPYTC